MVALGRRCRSSRGRAPARRARAAAARPSTTACRPATLPALPPSQPPEALTAGPSPSPSKRATSCSPVAEAERVRRRIRCWWAYGALISIASSSLSSQPAIDGPPRRPREPRRPKRERSRAGSSRRRCVRPRRRRCGRAGARAGRALSPSQRRAPRRRRPAARGRARAAGRRWPREPSTSSTVTASRNAERCRAAATTRAACSGVEGPCARTAAAPETRRSRCRRDPSGALEIRIERGELDRVRVAPGTPWRGRGRGSGAGRRPRCARARTRARDTRRRRPSPPSGTCLRRSR